MTGKSTAGVNTCELVAVWDHTAKPPRVVARFWWSDARGLTCDNAEIAECLADEGIATPPEGKIIYPAAGRAFFDALRFRFCSLLAAQRPVMVPRQGGRTLR